MRVVICDFGNVRFIKSESRVHTEKHVCRPQQEKVSKIDEGRLRGRILLQVKQQKSLCYSADADFRKSIDQARAASFRGNIVLPRS